MLSIMAVMGSYVFVLLIKLGAQWGSQISTGRDDMAGGSAVAQTLSEGLRIEFSDFEAEAVMLIGNYV
jgi:hypothetical protein